MAIPVLAAGVRVASVSNISLVQHCPQLILGAAGEWPARWKDKIAQVYGCTFRQILSTDAGGPVTVEALRSGQAEQSLRGPDHGEAHRAQPADHPGPSRLG